MANRTQLLAGLCLPLAVLIGFFLAEPLDIRTIAVLSGVVLLLLLPLALRWHHPVLILSWNAAITPSLLPGRPYLWMLTAAVSLLVIILTRAVNHRHSLRHEPSVTRALLVLLLVVITTACLTGGIGMRVIGSGTYGGRGYVFVLCAVAGYFGLCSVAIPAERARLYTGLFLLPGLTFVLANLAYSLGPGLWWLLRFLPAEYAIEQASKDASLVTEFGRISSLSPASIFLYAWLLATYGISGLVTWRRPLRPLLLILAWAACVYSGFRYALGVFLVLTALQFYLEGVHRTRLLPFLLAAGLFCGALVVANASRMPIVVQRSLSFLPIEVSPLARTSAQGSTEWRVEMWRRMLPEIPKYFLLGKGYTIDPNDLQMAFESDARGYGGRSLVATQAGDYHSGPLSVIIPFGVWGTLALLWFWAASLRYLYINYRRGDPRLRQVNTTLLALYGAKVVAFVFVFGGFYFDLAFFVGLVGLAVALNGPVNGQARTGSVSPGTEPARRAFAPADVVSKRVDERRPRLDT